VKEPSAKQGKDGAQVHNRSLVCNPMNVYADVVTPYSIPEV
jgi:hypothetical protein